MFALNCEFSIARMVINRSSASNCWRTLTSERVDSCRWGRGQTSISNIESIQHGHCDRVGPLIRQMAPDARPNAFVRLPHVDRFTVVVEESIDAPTEVPDRHWRSATPFERRIKEASEVFPQILSLEWRQIHRIRISTKQRA